MIRTYSSRQRHPIITTSKNVYNYNNYTIKEKIWTYNDQHELHRFYLCKKYNKKYICDVIANELILIRIVGSIMYICDNRGIAHQTFDIERI